MEQATKSERRVSEVPLPHLTGKHRPKVKILALILPLFLLLICCYGIFCIIMTGGEMMQMFYALLFIGVFVFVAVLGITAALKAGTRTPRE